MNDSIDLENNPFQILGKTPQKPPYTGYTTSNTYITTRDGVKIAATICIPTGLTADKKVPTLLYQTRYWRGAELRIPFRWALKETFSYMPITEIFTGRGYAIVYVDVRGCGASFGTRPFPFSMEEIKDGADIVDWIISQQWSDGDVVSNGISYSGITAELLGINNHPAVKALMAGHALWDTYADIAYPGGCYNTAFMQTWSFLGQYLDQNKCAGFKQIFPLYWLLLKGVNPVDSDKEHDLLKEAVLQHSSNKYVYDSTRELSFRDDYIDNDGNTFDTISVFPKMESLEKANVPILGWCSWLDSGYVDVVINRFLNLKNPQIAILGDWNHGAMLPANPFHPSRTTVIPSPKDRVNAWVNFFDTYLRGEGIQGKMLYYFTMGEEKWKKTEIWPPIGHTMQRWYFAENNALSTTIPQGESGADSYKVNFRASTGKNNRWWAPLGLPISYSNRAKADEKLLTYTSSPLNEDIEITGSAIITLFLSSTHEDGAIFAYLEDVDEQGNVTHFTDGNLRVIHRKISPKTPPYKMMVPYHSFKREDTLPLVPGEMTEITFGFHATSVLIRKGHRIRIAIAGADKDTHPRYPTEGKPTIVIERNETHASFIDIPVICKENEL